MTGPLGNSGPEPARPAMPRGRRAAQLRTFFLSPAGGAHIYDWLLGAVLIAITAGVTNNVGPTGAGGELGEQTLLGPAPAGAGAGTRTFVTVRDPSKLFPYAEREHVPSWALYVIIFVGPALVIGATQLWVRSWRDAHAAALSVFLAFAAAFAVKNWVNIGAGRTRPDWYAREARGGVAVLEDGRRAYPSGHAAYSFACMTVLALYILGKTRALAPPRPPGAAARAAAAAAPLAVGLIVSVSRTVDHRHDYSDINAGMAVGLLCGAIGYLLLYPPPTDPSCDRPRWPAADVELEAGAGVAAGEPLAAAGGGRPPRELELPATPGAPAEGGYAGKPSGGGAVVGGIPLGDPYRVAEEGDGRR